MTDPYLWSDDSGCLRNKLGIKDTEELERVEARLVTARDVQLGLDPIPGRYNLDHLQRIHEHLFQDVYDWAGETRQVNIAKPGSFFAPWPFVNDNVSQTLAKLSEDNYLLGRTKESFVARVAFYYGELNICHPFREGNGRAQRALLRQLGIAAGWHIDWSELREAENIEACKENLRTADPQVLIELLTPLVSHC